MSLTIAAIRNSRPQAKPQKLFDEGGLFRLVSQPAAMVASQCRFAGREMLLSLCTFPDTGLKAARERRDEARRQLASNIDPREHRKATKTATLNGRGK